MLSVLPKYRAVRQRVDRIQVSLLIAAATLPMSTHAGGFIDGNQLAGAGQAVDARDSHACNAHKIGDGWARIGRRRWSR
jgi:hypothetical protein